MSLLMILQLTEHCSDGAAAALPMRDVSLAVSDLGWNESYFQVSQTSRAQCNE